MPHLSASAQAAGVQTHGLSVILVGFWGLRFVICAYSTGPRQDGHCTTEEDGSRSTAESHRCEIIWWILLFRLGITSEWVMVESPRQRVTGWATGGEADMDI